MDGIVWFTFCFIYRMFIPFLSLCAELYQSRFSSKLCILCYSHYTFTERTNVKKVHGVLFVGNISCICVFECNATMMRYLGAKIFDTNVPIKIECVFANVSLVVVSRTKPVSVGASVDCARKSEKGRYQIY